jgi:hypothetical protein
MRLLIDPGCRRITTVARRGMTPRRAARIGRRWPFRWHWGWFK